MVNKIRLHWVDWAKSMAIFFVVLLHLHVTEPIREIFLLFVNSLFFMISGYLFKRIGFIKELKRSTISILFPCLIYICVISSLYYIKGGNNMAYLQNILVLNFSNLVGVFAPVCPLWFIVSLFIMRVISSQLPPPILTIISVLGIVVFHKYSSDYNYFMIITTALCYPSFAIGMSLKKYNVFERTYNVLGKFKIYSCACLFLVLGILIILGVKNGHVDMVQCLYGKSLIVFYLITNLISIVFIMLCNLLLRNENIIIKNISNGTLLILALHFPIMSTIKLIYDFNTPLSKLMLGVIIMFICYIGILLSKKYFPILLGKTKLKL